LMKIQRRIGIWQEKNYNFFSIISNDLDVFI
jgi:hypothetical protein